MRKEKSESYRAALANSGHLAEFKPSASQKVLVNTMIENTITFVEGVAGTGKSTAVLYHFCKEYLNDSTKNIMVIRTPVEVGQDKIGFLPDGEEKKLEPHFASSKKILKDFLGAKLECDMGKRVHFAIPNFILGSTLDNTLIFIDEAQQIPPLIMKLLLERIGKNSICVVGGDPSQLYVTDKRRNGFTDAVDRFIDDRGYALYPEVGYVEMDVEDVVRSEIVKTVIRAYTP